MEKELNIQEVKALLAGMEKKDSATADVHDTQTAGEGKETVQSTSMASRIIEKARIGTLAQNFPTPFDLPTPIYQIPVETTDPQFFAADEITDGIKRDNDNAQIAGTSNVTITSKMITTAVYMSSTLDEDSVINFQQYLENKISKAYGELIDNMLVRADTTAGASNVNGNIATNNPLRQQDGIWKGAIANGNVVNCGPLTGAKIIEARAKLGIKGLNPNDLLMIPSVDVYYKLMGLSQVETMEKFGGAATISNGTISALYGIKIAPLTIPKTNSSGVVDATAGNNIAGSILIVRKEDVLSGFSRKLKIDPEYIPANGGVYAMHVSLRYGQVINGTDAASALVNITL